jgi:hypothetical protein
MEVDGTLAELSESQSEPSTPPDADVAMADEDGYETGESTDADGDAVTEMEQALAEALGLALRPTSAASSSDAPSVGSSEHAPKPVASDEGKPHSHSHPGSSASSSVPSPQAPAAKLPAVPPFQWTFMSHSI